MKIGAESVQGAGMLLQIADARRQQRLRILYLVGGLFVAHQLLELLIALIAHHPFLGTCHWDCHWYVGIAQDGYAAAAVTENHQTNWAFFPLFPLLVAAVKAATAMPYALAAVILGKILFLFAIYAFIEFAGRYSEGLSPVFAGLVVALNPYAIYGNAGYTEPLFLLLTCVFYILLKDRRYLACGLVGALLSASRVPGILVVLPYAIVVAEHFSAADRDRRMEMLLGGCLIPLGLALYMLHLYHVTGDALAFVHVQKAWGRPLGNPLLVIAAGFAKGNIHLVWAAMSLLALLASLYLIYRRRLALGVFSLCSTLIPLSTGLQSMPRYLWWQAPLLLVLAGIIGRNRLARAVLLPVFLLGLVYMYIAWMAVKSWTV